MTVHLLKMAVGVADIGHLRSLQQGRRHEIDGRLVVFGYTRRRPRQVEAVTGGGSIYWIIRGFIQVRQRVLDLREELDEEGLTFCRMHLDPVLVATEPTPRRPMQGWRYLPPGEVPADLGTAGEAGLPPELARELSRLGIF